MVTSFTQDLHHDTDAVSCAGHDQQCLYGAVLELGIYTLDFGKLVIIRIY